MKLMRQVTNSHTDPVLGVWDYHGVHRIKEGVLLRNVSPSLVLCVHFPGGGILELQTGSSWEWPFIACLFWE